jgi:D-alanyl-D-alanine carboxypeptidase-like protein
MALPDVYQGSGPRSANVDNTPAFNCHLMEGTNNWSMHAYGLAVDINPRENVYIDGGYIDPPRCKANGGYEYAWLRASFGRQPGESALGCELVYRCGEFELNTVGVFERQHIDAERGQAGDAAVGHALLVE